MPPTATPSLATATSAERPRPTAAQLAWQRVGFGLFLHFGINTFHGREWSDGTLPASSFDPTDFDATQWVDVARQAGAGYVVLTAKHHDGFCLWPTETTDYSVRSAAWRGGAGDVVGELAAACRAAGMPLGLYLSPWDRNAACYSDPAGYDRFYLAQLTELCTRYGPLFELWFDGAGSEGRSYDWESIMGVLAEHQPDAMIFNMGRPTIRWVGNEDGVASDPVRYAVSRTGVSVFTDAQAELAELAYAPPECDVPIRANWFWQPDDLHTLKSVDQLLDIWYASVGLGAGLLLNLGPDRSGRIPQPDVTRLLATTTQLRRRFAGPLPARLRPAGDHLEIVFAETATFDQLELCEELTEGQAIDGYQIRLGGVPLVTGQTVGIRRWLRFEAVTTDRLTLHFTGPPGHLTTVTAFQAH